MAEIRNLENRHVVGGEGNCPGGESVRENMSEGECPILAKAYTYRKK